MKSHQGGIHQPGLHPAGETEPTREEFAAFTARVEEWIAALTGRVKALEAGGGGGGGGKTYLFAAITGANGAIPSAFNGARVGDRVVLVSSVILANTPPLQDNGGGAIFETVISVDGQILQTSDSDQSGVGFLIVLERDAGDSAPGASFRLVSVGGGDGSGGDFTTGVPGFKDWLIVDAIRYNTTDPGGSPSNAGEWGNISDVFYSPIPTNNAITFKGGPDTSAFKFLLLLQSP